MPQGVGFPATSVPALQIAWIFAGAQRLVKVADDLPGRRAFVGLERATAGDVDVGVDEAGHDRLAAQVVRARGNGVPVSQTANLGDVLAAKGEQVSSIEKALTVEETIASATSAELAHRSGVPRRSLAFNRSERQRVLPARQPRLGRLRS